MSDSARSPFKIAAVQAAPVFLDRDASIEKACTLIAEAGKNGARLAVFSEGFIPTYPMWVWFIPTYKTHDLRFLYDALMSNALSIPSPQTDILCEAAREAGVTVAIGVNEINTEASGGTLYNTILYIGSNGEILGKHRKLIPTVGERFVHGMGDGSTLEVFDTDFGKLSGLICWENYMPLARYSLYADGVQIYVAPTWDRGEPWVSTLRHIAKEGRVYVIGCCSPVRRADIPDTFDFIDQYVPEMEWLNPGGSTIIDPDGKFLVEPVVEKEEILYAEVNPANFQGPRFQLDVAGHYGRGDIFDLSVRRDPQLVKRDLSGLDTGD